jgi:hypothetical protein
MAKSRDPESKPERVCRDLSKGAGVALDPIVAGVGRDTPESRG